MCSILIRRSPPTPSRPLMHLSRTSGHTLKSLPQAMAKTVDKQWLTAAECAARTGLTVRALRVYEREGLVSPARSEKGWRRYGPAEVARLNTVTTLKALGLTLEQI